MCEPVAQALTLGIDCDGPRFEEDRDQVCPWQKQQKIPSCGPRHGSGATTQKVDHHKTEHELPDTLTSDRISQ